METQTSSTNDYRNTMVRYLGEAQEMIGQLLSGADFEGAFPHIFGNSENDPRIALRSENGLLLRKAQLHIEAVLRANKNNNLHSMAVQMRVVLECAAQVRSKANSVCEGSSEAFARTLNVTESDYQYTMLAASGGQVDLKTIQEGIVNARRGIGQHGVERPKRVTVTDRIESLSGGSGWYDYLSEFFCHPEAGVLAGSVFSGGVVSAGASELDLTFAVFLEYLTNEVMVMLAGSGFLLIAVNGDTQPFDDALALKERWLEDAHSTRPAGWPGQKTT